MPISSQAAAGPWQQGKERQKERRDSSCCCQLSLLSSLACCWFQWIYSYSCFILTLRLALAPPTKHSH